MRSAEQIADRLLNTCSESDVPIEDEDEYEYDLAVHYDVDVARMYFEDEFEVINSGGGFYDRTPLYFFIGGGQFSSPSDLTDCYDFSECKERDFRKFCEDQGGIRESFDLDIVPEDLPEDHDTWEDYAREILDSDIGIYEACKEGFPDIKNAKLLYNCVSTTGHSQGDYAYVLYEVDEGFLSDEQKATKVFSNLIWDAPVYARLEVTDPDGETTEYYLDQAQSDSYSWDKDEAVEYLKKEGAPEQVIEWFEENAPEYPV